MKKRNDAFSRFLSWLENGDEALLEEMEDTLSEDQGKETAALSLPGKKKKSKKQNSPDNNRTAVPGKAWSERWWYRVFAFLLCVIMIGLLLFAVLKLPKFGGADTLVDSELTKFYVENTEVETGAENIVTGIILGYRGFDTLGESHVLFIAVCTVLLMLSIRGEKDERLRILANAKDRLFEPRNDLILQCAARILTPLIFVFGIYIIFNGHLSPGGGFSGGAVLGAGLILYQNAFGYEKIEKFFNYKTFKGISVCALLFYSFSKGYHFFTGANHINSGIRPGIPGMIFSGGLFLPLNIAVGCVVACTMYALYTMFRKGDF